MGFCPRGTRALPVRLVPGSADHSSASAYLRFAALSFLALPLAGAQEPPTPAPAAEKQAAVQEEADSLKACAKMVLEGFRKIAATRDQRFEGKVEEATALCRGGQKALLFRNTPWVDWSWYWGAGDESSLPAGLLLKNASRACLTCGAGMTLKLLKVRARNRYVSWNRPSSFRGRAD